MRRYVPSGTVAVQNSIVINPAYPRYALHEKMRIDYAILNPVARRLFFADKVGFSDLLVPETTCSRHEWGQVRIR